MSEQEDSKKMQIAVANVHEFLNSSSKVFDEDGRLYVDTKANIDKNNAIMKSLNIILNGNNPDTMIIKDDVIKKVLIPDSDRYITAHLNQYNDLDIRIHEEEVRTINQKFHECGLSIPMIDVAMDGNVNKGNSFTAKFSNRPENTRGGVAS